MLCISQDFVLRNTAVSDKYLRVAKTRAKTGSAKAWKFISFQGKSYFLYDSLPAQTRDRLPEPETLRSYAVRPASEIESLINESKLNGYKLFLSVYSEFGSDKQKNLCISASIVHEAKNRVEINHIPWSKSQFFEDLATGIDLCDIKYLPRSWRNLRDKIRLYACGTPVRELINAKNEGNSNAAEFKNNDLIIGWLMELANSQKNYTSAFIFRKIRLLCLQSDIGKHPSIRWVSDYMARNETKFLIKGRYGDGSRFGQKYRAYTPAKTALYAGDCWQIDGTRVNIIGHHETWTDKDGKRRSGQKFLYIVAVRDVMSGLPLGWEYCCEESAATVIGALSMAVRNAGYLPYELIYDRFPGHNTGEWAFLECELRRQKVIMTVAHKAEGKANIERWFGSLQSVFMTESDLYYGEGVQSSRRYAHRSKEYVYKMHQWAKKNGFNFDDAVREMNAILDRHNSRPYSEYSRKFHHIDKSPQQLHDESDCPNTYPIAEHEFCYLFGLRKGVSISNHLITTQIEGATFYYGIDDCGLVERYTGEKLTNCFDYEDLSRVHLYDGITYLGTFARIEEAQRFGPDKDMRAVGKMKKIAKANDERRKEKLQAIETRKKTAEAALEIIKTELSPEMGIILAGREKKHACEAAETNYLHETWEIDEEEILNTRELIKY
jgi:transposase InsO family protein